MTIPKELAALRRGGSSKIGFHLVEGARLEDGQLIE